VDSASRTDGPRFALDRYLPFLPCLVAAILSIPVLGFTYLWDDYNFLTNALYYKIYDWLPGHGDPFYRPISRGVYFSILDLAGRNGELLGHLLNLCFLAAIVYFLGTFTARIAGRKAGLFASLLYAGLGAAPALVGWTCCAQDLLAILFALAALHLRLAGRNRAAIAAVAAGLLSKETTLAIIPALVLFDWIADRRPHRIWRTAAAYGLLVAVWSAFHPAVRTLLARGLRSGETGYVGLEHPASWLSNLGRYLLTLLNLPAYWPLPSWPTFGTILFVTAFVVVAITLRLAKRLPEMTAESRATWPRPQLMLLGATLALGPLLLTSTMIGVWAPYYAGFAAVGFSMIGGLLLVASSFRTQVMVLALYFASGLWARGDPHDPEQTVEWNFRVVSTALRQVEPGFRRLYPTFPPGAQVLLSVQARGVGSIYTHMYSFQVLRIWYRDRSIRVVRPEERKPTMNPELLTVITPDRDVIDINPRTLYARSASGKDPDYHICEHAIRAYAMGLAGSGETGAAVDVLLHMPEINIGLATVHRRMAAMFLFADGRNGEAAAILDSTVALPRGVALADLHAVLAEQPPRRVFDPHALRAFGISPDDLDAARDLMRWFAAMKYVQPALRFAQRVEKLNPGDPEAKVVTQAMNALLEEQRRAFPGPDVVE
jgi:hypothetical protein